MSHPSPVVTQLDDFLYRFEHEVLPISDETKKLAQTSVFLLEIANFSPHFKIELCESLYPLIHSDRFSTDPDLRRKGIVRLQISISSARFFLGDIKTAIEQLEKALIESQQLNFVECEAEAKNLLGDIYTKQGRFIDAISCFEQALVLFQQLGLLFNEASVLNNLGILYMNLSEYPSALNYYGKASAILEQLGETTRLAPVYNNIGQVSFMMSEFDDALTYYQKSLALCDGAKMERGVALLYGNIGAVYEKKGDYDNALLYQEKSLRLKESLEDQRGIAYALRFLGEIYLSKKNYPIAISKFKLGLSISETIQNDELIAENAIMLGRSFSLFYTENSASAPSENEALNYLHRGEAIGKKIVSRRLKQLAHQYLAEEYERQNDFQKAFSHFKSYYSIKSEVFNDESDKRVKNLQIMFKVEETKKQAELERVKNVELVNALNEAERQKQIAEEASRVKSEVLNVVAHDLQTPISSVINFSYLLKQSNLLSEKHVEMLSRIETVSQTMLRQTVNLLNAASERVSSELQYEKINLEELIQDVIKHCGSEKKQQSVLLSCEAPCWLEGDKDKLREAIENIISNAVKYSARGKLIKVKIQREEAPKNGSDLFHDSLHHSHFIISVKDEGPGLSEADLSKMFGKFQRLSAKPTAGESSTGLGLYITKQIVELHGGKIWAESLGIGQGTTFMIQLPSNLN